MKKLILLVAAGAGYVLGAKAGRERYDQIRRTFTNVKEDPRVQSAASTVAQTAKEQGPVVADKMGSAASSAKGKVSDKVGGGSGDDLTEELHPESTARQEDPYPKGDLP